MGIAPAHVTEDQHVRVVPVARSRVGGGFVLRQCNAPHAIPRVDNIPARAPAVAVDGSTPTGDVGHAVLAKTIHDVARLLTQQVPHQTIGSDRGLAITLAPTEVERTNRLRIKFLA